MKIKVYREAIRGYDDVEDEYDSQEEFMKALPELFNSVDGICYVKMEVEVVNNPHKLAWSDW